MKFGWPAKIWKSPSKIYYTSKSYVKYFYVFTHMIWLLDILLSVRFIYFPINAIHFLCRSLKHNCSPFKVQRQQIYHGMVLQSVLIKKEGNLFIPRLHLTFSIVYRLQCSWLMHLTSQQYVYLYSRDILSYEWLNKQKLFVSQGTADNLRKIAYAGLSSRKNTSLLQF